MTMFKQSASEFERALKVIPTGIHGHLGPVAGCAIPVDAFPKFAARSEGTYFWDLDGNRFIDYMCAYGPNILGYADADVDRAVMEQMRKGDCASVPFTTMIDMAELLVDTVASADWAFFAKNGGDVTSLALMTAKAATGRKKTIMVKGNYHGVAPWTQKAGYPGVVEEDVTNNLYVEWNNLEQLKQTIADNKGEIACFISTPYWHPAFEDNALPAENYWQEVRKLCTENGIVLAIDDVRCGFRLDLKGSDHYYGFEADLICFCKAIGNGYNFSALCGTDAMKDAVSSVFYTGSYWLASQPFAAGIATINKLRAIEGDQQVLSMGRKLTTGLHEVGRQHGFDLRISGEPSMWYMRITNDDNLMLHQQWVAECVKRGVFFANHHNLFMNCAITDDDIQFTLDVANDAFQVVAANNPALLLK
ncbi:aminotransferase class III-fold pyridoxal phosphate-dependent enzyme [Saccharospirillum mangrovi]|uniref:aminotransferase class III-fold pyridoxal phosphate-dependent enzyme n=1 Tax=Saccharospirillum mangrovi TaxID=2161747 RepID=UPI000D3B1C11|nr:aminotransferase class III-fold pyridoxal phosphate-dependent enzyme [Saccharospirillum mangrovi]